MNGGKIALMTFHKERFIVIVLAYDIIFNHLDADFVINHFLWKSIDPDFRYLWKWDGQYYQFSGMVYEEPITYSDPPYISESMRVQSQIDLLQSIIDQWGFLNIYDYSSYYQLSKDDYDLLRLFLGFKYLQTDREIGMDMIQKVADFPEYPEKEIPSKVANTFLGIFTGEPETLLPACKTTSSQFDRLSDDYWVKHEFHDHFCDTGTIF